MKFLRSVTFRFIGIAVVFALLPSLAFAGRYELVQGQGVEVCETYGKALNAVDRPMRCDRELPPQFADIQKPKWEEADVRKNRLLIARILNYLEMPGDYKATKPLTPAIPDDRLETFKPFAGTRLLLAKFDIDNDGTPVWVAKFGSPACDEWDDPQRAPRWRHPLLIVDPEKQTIDVERTAPLMQNRGKLYVTNADQVEQAYKDLRTPEQIAAHKPGFVYKESNFAPGISRLQGYDAFLFSGSAYFDRWDEARNGGAYETLTVYKIENGNADQVCRYQFHK